jgi:poly-gamma-glutamate synthesis protein (capsule biosynthesis protein)
MIPTPAPVFPATSEALAASAPATSTEEAAAAELVVEPVAEDAAASDDAATEEAVASEPVAAESALADAPIADSTTADDTTDDDTTASGPFAAVGAPAPIPSQPGILSTLGSALADAPIEGPLSLALDPALPAAWATALRDAVAGITSVEQEGVSFPLSLTDGEGTTTIALGAVEGTLPLLSQYFAVVVPFDTLQDDIPLADLQARWQGGDPLLVSDSALEYLPTLLGKPGENVRAVAAADLIGALEADRTALGLIGFEQIDPRFKVLTVDGVNLLSNQLVPGAYPVAIEATISGSGAARLRDLLGGAVEPATNRDASRLTTLVMTGVTAMARGTADAIERSGRYEYPAEIIGPELALADITHVSNEIPFIEGCVVQNTLNNLILCSKPEYWAALELMGTDIVGLSGNHVNDFGRDGARESLGWYKENNIPIYGSGLTVDEACAPLLWQHGSNTFAFIAALAYGPESAWVTDSEPGACYYYEHKDRILETVRALAEQVDVVAVELQYEETYFAYPTPAQVVEFRELRAAGADLVTGVQSHVPQAQEPYGSFDEGGAGMISYGLGNLYFDQMWSWETRSELYARHTIYNGQIINTEILTGVLEDYAQPRWATPEERADILSTIFAGAPSRP